MSCECKLCPLCGGDGYVFYSFGGEFLGTNRCDDLDRIEPCDHCYNGITEECDECLNTRWKESQK